MELKRIALKIVWTRDMSMSKMTIVALLDNFGAASLSDRNRSREKPRSVTVSTDGEQGDKGFI